MTLIQRIAREPQAITALLTASIAVLLVFDVVSLTEIQTGALLGVLAAVLLVIRQYVTPVKDPRLPEGTLVNGGTARVSER